MSINKTHITLFFAAILFGFTACGKDNPGLEYAPQMYHSIPLEAYTQIADIKSPFRDSVNAQSPPDYALTTGGHYNFKKLYANDSTGKANAGAELKNPTVWNDQTKAEAKVLYLRFCSPCHGSKGEGGEAGLVAQRMPVQPNAYSSEKLKVLRPGEILHTIMYGKGGMGSYSSQLSFDERWKVVHYIEMLQGKEKGLGDVEQVDLDGDGVAVDTDENNEEAYEDQHAAAPPTAEDAEEANHSDVDHAEGQHEDTEN